MAAFTAKMAKELLLIPKHKRTGKRSTIELSNRLGIKPVSAYAWGEEEGDIPDARQWQVEHMVTAQARKVERRQQHVLVSFPDEPSAKAFERVVNRMIVNKKGD